MILLGGALTTPAYGADWPQFRGPNGSGVIDAGTLPAEWAAGKNLKWKIDVPGVGWSCPVVVGDKVFVTTAVSENQRKPGGGGGFGGGGGGAPGGGKGRAAPDKVFQFQLICLDVATGKQLWKETPIDAKPKIPTHGSNTYATETPVTDGERVYAYFGMHGLFCYDLAGKQVWKKDLGTFPMMAGWGTASSPVLDGDRLFVQCDNDEKSFIVALDKKNGKEIWREPRAEKSTWCTPLVWKTGQRTEIVTIGNKVRSYNPADGKVLWELTIGGGQCSVSPVADGDLLFVGAGVGGGGRPGGGRPGGMGGSAGNLFAIKAGASGDITPKEGETSSAGVAWVAPKAGLGMASPLVYKGHVYVFERNGGLVSCFDEKTGKAVYTKERIPGARAFWASPYANDGKVFATDEAGTTFVLEAGPKFNVLAQNSLQGMFWTTPSVAGDAVLLRSTDSLFCVKK